MQAVLVDMKRTAEEFGLNLFVSDFGQPNLIVALIREKVPPQIESEHACWYLVQHLDLQPTGEVYPCALPTTYKLGNLNYDEPMDIWNGPVAQKLRAAHYAKRGPLFCAGCIHTPHLPARRPVVMIDWLRKVRMRRADVRNRRERERCAADESPVSTSGSLEIKTPRRGSAAK